MNTHSSRAALLLSGLLAAATSPAHALDITGLHPGDMTRYEMPNYTLIAVDNLQLKRDIARLPSLYRAMELALGVKSQTTGIPTYVYVVSSSMWEKYLEPGKGIISEFVPTRFANYVIANGAQINRVGLFHEHSHLFLYTQLAGAYPLWFDEGVAEEMSLAQFSGATVRYFPTRGTGEGGWLATDRLMRVTKSSPEYLNSAQNHSFHYQSRVMVHRALVDDPDFGKSVFKYLTALNNLQSVDEAAKSSFDVSLPDLDYQIRAYLGRSQRYFAKMELGPVDDAPVTAGRELSKLESLLGIATVALDAGLHIDRVHELLDGAEALPGGSERTRALRMRLAARLADDAELERLYAALKPKLGDVQLARATGLALFERVLTLADRPPPAAQIQQLLSRSFELLNVALAAQPDDPEAVWAYATLASGLNRDLNIALQRLEPMFAKMPRNPDMATAAALIHDARGNYADMLPCLVATYTFSHSFDQKRWAAQKIGEVNQKLEAAKAQSPLQ